MTLYNLVFQGEILDQSSLSEVKNNLARLFKADTKKIDQLFSGKQIVIKKELETATARKYLAVFKNAGAKVRAVQVTAATNDGTEQNIEDQKPDPLKQHHDDELNSASGLSEGLASLISYKRMGDTSSETLAAAENSATDTLDTELTLSAANSGVFAKLSRGAAINIPDISQLSMSPPNSGSLEEFAEIIAPIVIPDIDHIHLSDPDNSTLKECELPMEAVELPNISSMELAAQKDQELSAKSTKPEPIKIPDTSMLSLAEAAKGSLEVPRKKAAAAVIPDTSHLEIELPEDNEPVRGKAVFKIDSMNDDNEAQ